MITAELLNTLAWSLVHFLWQGAAIAALAAALFFVFRAPATRYLIGIGALAAMLASFVITFTILSGPQNPSDRLASARAPAAALASPAREAIVTRVAMLEESRAATSSSDSFLWVARAWLAGVFVLALRIALGLLVLEHLRRRNLLALPRPLVARFEALQARLGLHRDVRYRECRLVPVPAVIGFFRPIVLLPMRALTGLSPEQLDAVIAHELAHIKRFDVAVNFFQVVAETLFFFHPAVWWLNKRIRADREDCCDDVAVASSGTRVSYARALATMEDWRGLPNLAMAATGSPIAARVARLLGVRQNATAARTAGVVTASLVLTVAVVAGAVSFGVAQPAQAQSRTETNTESDVAPPAPEAPPVALPPAPNPPPPPVKAPKAAEPKTPKPPVPVSPATPADVATPATPAAPAARARATAPAAVTAPSAAPSADSYISTMTTVIKHELEAEDLVALKVHDVSPEFVIEMRNIDVNIDTNEIIAMKVQGVTQEYAREMRGTGFQADADQLIAMKVHGVTPAYVQGLRDLKLEFDTDEMIAMKVHNVTPEYVKGLGSLGLHPNTGDIIGFKVFDVQPEFVREIRSLGYEVDADKIIAMKSQGLTSDYVKKMRALGFKPDDDEIVAMKVHNVSPEYVSEIRGAGFQPNTDEIIAMKVHGVTAAYAKTLADAGFKADVEELIQAKAMGIDEAFIEKAKKHGFKDLNIEKLVALKNADII